MYAKKTTVLSNSTVLGVYLDDASNVVKTTADTQDTMKDFLKGTGLSTDKDTAYYVNYGVRPVCIFSSTLFESEDE